MTDDTTAREALARELCRDRDCCDEGCYAGLRSADRLLAHPALDAVVAERVAALAENVRRELRDERRYDPSTYNVWARVSNAVERALAAALREKGSPEVSETTHDDEQTLAKVYGGLADAGIVGQQAIDAVFQMQNHGVLFRERDQS